MADVRLRKKLGKGRHASAIKRERQNLKRREHNKHFRSMLRSAMKNVRVAITGKDKAKAREALNRAISIISKTAQKGIIHKTTANRYKSRLTIAVSRLS